MNWRRGETTRRVKCIAGDSQQVSELPAVNPYRPAATSILASSEERIRLRGIRQKKRLREYDGRSDLHVGITNTNGVVYNYSAHGVQRDGEGWEESISIPLLQPNMYGMMEQWDKYLEDFSTSGAWLPHRYEDNHHNCYSYALTFINCVLMAEGRQQLDKGEFTEKYVVPRTRLASKFITLYRAIREHGFYVTDCPQQEAQPPEGGGLC
ncbi:MKRN2 opposite strand protein isoform X2 [Pan paniscus]|uniref:MKRN2 opposite strand protein isoform X2 n=1 Tax=Pan paniscus TaxID=9597 RepID=UPI0015614251|nr:MKRN2 opposite strand protein isoform X2 [Pan paniscus]